MVGPFFVVASHIFERVPPNLFENEGFITVNEAPVDIRVPVVLMFGFFRELASTLPYRLPSVALQIALQSVGYVPSTVLSWASSRAHAPALHEEGWAAFDAVLYESGRSI